MRMEDITGLTGDTVEVSRSSTYVTMADSENYFLFQDVEEAQETQETSFEGGGATWYTGEGSEGADCDSPRGAVQDV